jgi:2-polyprenyl-3-methyl-5-hydroxy-6-metoxy-1,4-benzoquinol methylase
LEQLSWLAKRGCEAELMDDPLLDRPRHWAALRGLSRLNGLSFSASILWPPIMQLARRLNVTRLRVLDIATGAGDLPLRLWRRARGANLQLDLHGVDISSQALDFARQNAEAEGAAIQFSQMDVLSGQLPRGYDVVMSSLFFHHLSDPQASALLGKMTEAANHLVLVNDLRRSVAGWLLAHAAARLFTRSDVVHFDAPVSVKAALTIKEMASLASALGQDQVTIQRRWPCRFLLAWRRPSSFERQPV